MADQPTPDPRERIREHARTIREVYLRDRRGKPHTHQDWTDYLDALLAHLKAQPEPERAQP